MNESSRRSRGRLRSQVGAEWSRPGELALVADDSLEGLLGQVARGDQRAFEQVFERVAAPVYGIVRRVLRDPAQSEEIAQEVLLEVWRQAARFSADRGSAMSWVLTIAHRRAVDRVRTEAAASARTARAFWQDGGVEYDQVAEQVEVRLEQERVRRCLDTLTDLQRESVDLAYYGGYTYREVGELLGVALGTVKTRLRDGLIRMRDCLGVER
ncbi:MAG: ECF RNA polymerase sigma factor SigK [Sporichthyaceae bacterium]|nr:ECF RNA polymerase sigma factor SigK [Sporichthyaceae bacterium]